MLHLEQVLRVAGISDERSWRCKTTTSMLLEVEAFGGLGRFHHDFWWSRRQCGSLRDGYGRQSRPCGRAYSASQPRGAPEPGKQVFWERRLGRVEQPIIGFLIGCSWGVVLDAVVGIGRPVPCCFPEIWGSHFGIWKSSGSMNSWGASSVKGHMTTGLWVHTLSTSSSEGSNKKRVQDCGTTSRK